MASTSPATVNLGRSILWTPYKELFAAVEAAIIKKEPDAVSELEILLRAHQPCFLSLLSNPAKSTIHRAMLQNASSEGITIKGQSALQILPQSIVDEALVISEMFDLNELTSLELLITGQQQQPSFPGLTRGLVSVLLYYDGRRNIVNTLRALVQAREGRTWTLGLNNDLLFIITNYTDQLHEDGMILKVLEILEKNNAIQEVDILQKNRALGGPRYRKQVVDLIEEVRQSLSEIVFCWSCQSVMPFRVIKNLMEHLAKHSTLKGDGTLDSVAVTLLMALLYAIDVSVLQTCEEIDSQVKRCPLISDPQSIKNIHKEIMSEKPWEIPGILSIIRFAWSITLRTLLQYSWALQGADINEFLELDEKVLEIALNQNCLQALNNLIVKSNIFPNEEFYIKRIHGLVTDFISLMPLKLKELRNQGDESARIALAHLHEGLQPPANLNRHFEHLIAVISNLYKKSSFEYELAFEYWCPSDNITDPSFMDRPPQRQISLYKFIRLAGDILPAPLFVPYVTMLTTLSQSAPCAHQCYVMLKMNGRNSGTQSSIVSWDHFFESLHQYYTNLRQEATLTLGNQHLYQQRSHNRGISPQEVEGLSAILKLITTVVEHDDMARISLWENPQYVPGVVIVGLIGCSVPPEVKASLLNVLASFSLSSEIAGSLWMQLEFSQIIPTVKTLSKYQSTGIYMDLIEVEIRMEEYPITKAALNLINSLLKHPLPTSLGTGQRRPGFDPYLDYVKDTIFLQLQNRAYKSEGDKWQLSLICIEIMVKLLKDYEMSQSDFIGHSNEIPSGISMPTSQPPGYTLMVLLLQDSQLLRLILLILDEGTHIFDSYAPPNWHRMVEKCTFLCLQLIYEVLIRQDEFLSHMRNSGSSLLVTSLDRLLLCVNPRSGQPDYMIIFAKYVTYSVFLPKHALEATINLEILCKISQIAQQLVGAFTSSTDLCETLLHGFVECLDTDVPEEHIESELENGIFRVRSDSRQHILQLLLTCLNHPSPNLSHLLLGYQTRKPVSQTVLQDPGILNAPRTCLHSILSILDRGCDTKGSPVAIHETPHLAEMGYHLLHVLCANKDTTNPTLRYLRTNRDFVYRHIQFLPFQPKNEADQMLLFGQQSWLLKTLALELRILAIYQQRSHIQRLLKLLLEDSPDNRDQQPENESMDSTLRSSFLVQVPSLPGSVRRKLLQMLDSMIFTNNWPTPPLFEYLDSSKVEKALVHCESEDTNGQKIVNVYQFHQRLVEDLPAFQGLPALSHRPPFTSEVRGALQYALQRNKTRQAIQSKQQIFDAWRQVTEVIFSACPLEPLSGQTCQVTLEICQELLGKVLEDGALPGLTAPASGVILILISNLYENLVSSGPSREPQPPIASFVSSLAVVLRGVIESLIKTGIGVQRVRVNYYGTLLSLLRIVQRPDNNKINIKTPILDKESDIEKLGKEYMSVILSFGDSLVNMISRDACGGHDVTKMSALATLDTIICLDKTQHWLSFLESKGYLRHIISSLSTDDEELQKLLSKGSDLKAMFVFESKLSLLIRVASSFNGAQGLIRCGLISKLCECDSIDMRPEKDYSTRSYNTVSDDEAYIQHIKCFQQILKPVFKVVLAVVTSLGEHHFEAGTQLLYFITTHSEVFNQILRDQSVMANFTIAEELSLATALLARLARDLPNDSPAFENAMIEKQGQISLLHSRTLAVLQTVSSAALCQPRLNTSNNMEELSLKVTLMQVIANILSSCRADVSRSFTSRANFLGKVLFLPELIDTKSQDLYLSEHKSSFQQRGIKPPNLGMLVTLLQKCSEQVHTTVNNKKKIDSSLKTIAVLSVGELSDWLPLENKSELSTQEMRELAKINMIQLSQIRKQEISLHTFIIESVLLLLWRHLEYFLKFCIPDENNFGGHQDSNVGTDFRGPHIKVSKQDLDMLKADIKSVINEQFFNRVHSVMVYLSNDKISVDFSEALLRQVKRLVKMNVN